MHSSTILLFQNSEPWVKKDFKEDFDVPMGYYDGGEICEYVSSIILSQLGPVTEKYDIGLYQDYGLWVFRGTSKPTIERSRKLIVKTVKQCGLSSS